jgi:hypothetical protein
MRLSVSWRSVSKIGMKDYERFVFADLSIWKGWIPTTVSHASLADRSLREQSEA